MTGLNQPVVNSIMGVRNLRIWTFLHGESDLANRSFSTFCRTVNVESVGSTIWPRETYILGQVDRAIDVFLKSDQG